MVAMEKLKSSIGASDGSWRVMLTRLIITCLLLAVVAKIGS